MNNFFRRMAMCLTMLVIVAYLGYRGSSTLNLSGPFAIVFSLVVYAAELYGALQLFLYFFNIWELSERGLAPALPGRTVDVLIPTYNEDPQLLRGTISAALAIEYPHRTYVLDDSRRPEVKALALELGATYISRENNLHAKAGNLNYALDQTDGEFVVIFDADQLSAPNFIGRLIGYFTDERLAFVQTPHAFYNFDSFQARLDYKRAKYWEEGELFYNLVQPGKNRWNAVTFCGSAAIFRRAALEDVGLIATETITEDMHTGLRIHAKGWKSLFVNERLISSLAAPDITAYHSQRLRWGEGNLGVFFFDNPITMTGLTLAQRLSYLGSALSWTTGLQKLVLYVTPAIMLLTGIAPVNNLTMTLAIVTASYLAAIWIGVKLVSNGHSRLIAEEMFHMACFWTHCRSMFRAVMNRERARFIVTSKRGRQSSNVWRHLVPQLLYISLAMAAVTWAGARYYFGLSQDVVGLVIGAALLGTHSLFAWAVVCRGLRQPDARYSWRHPCAAHVRYELATAEGILSGQAITEDLNERGASLIAFEKLSPTGTLQLKISAGGTTVEVRGRIRHEIPLIQRTAGAHGRAVAYRYGIQFEELTTAPLAALWKISGGYAVSRQYERFHKERERLGETSAERGSSALDLRIPVSLDVAHQQPVTGGTVTEWMDAGKFACLLPLRLGENARRQFRIDTPFGPVRGEAVLERVAECMVQGRPLFSHQFGFSQFDGQSRSVVQSVLQTAGMRAVCVAVAPVPRAQSTPIIKPLITNFVLGSTMATAVALASLLVFRDDIALSRVARGDSASPRDIAILDHYASLAVAGKLADHSSQMAWTLAGLHRLDRNDQLNAIWDSPLATSKMTPAERLSRAQTRAGLGDYAKAEEDFQLLLKQAAEPSASGLPPKLLPELYLAAARNSANEGKSAVAEARYVKAVGLHPGDAQVVFEYAGALLTNHHVDEAIAALKSVTLNEQSQSLLASAYVQKKNYPAAVAIYRDMLRRDPHNPGLQLDLANILSWSGDYDASSALYRKLLETRPDDPALKQQLVRGLLAAHQYDQALDLLRVILRRDNADPYLQQEYLDAAAASRTLTAADRKIVLGIFARSHGELARRPPEFAARLVDVLSRLHERDKVIPLLQWLVETDPDNLVLHRRLADALSDAGRFGEAEIHYQLLLAHRRQPPRLPSPGQDVGP